MDQIYKYRSFSASLASGYKLFRANIRTILIGSWIEALVFGVILGLTLVAFYFHYLPAEIAAIAALVVASIFWNGRLFQLIDGGKPKEKLWRATKAMMWAIPFFVVPLICIPCINVAMETMLEEQPRPVKALFTGFKHWGYLFSTLLMSCIIMVALSLVLCIPLYICVYGVISDHIGVSGGDPSGLPTLFPLILFFVGALTGFFFLFAQLWQTYALAYAHGAILTRDNIQQQRKRENANNEIKATKNE